MGAAPENVETEETALPAEVQDELEASQTPLRRTVRVAVFLASLFLFVLAIQLLKTGAAPLSQQISEGFFPFNNLISTLGLGMVLAYLTLSGKPPAALALAFFVSGGIGKMEAFTMLSGGRLGAAFIVLLVGFLYSLRGRNRRESIGMGVLSLGLTAIVYVPAIVFGYLILSSNVLSGVTLTSVAMTNVVNDAWGPIVNLALAHLPVVGVIVVGVLVIVVAIKLLDYALPDVDANQAEPRWRARLTQPWFMFALGCLVTLVTLSVSVALTVLVPLAAKGYLKRGEAIPYILGSNVMTLADTLLIAVLFGNAVGAQIVLAEFIAVGFVTVVILAFFYKPVTRAVIALDEWVVESNRRLAIFVASLFVLPGLLMLSGLFIGHPAGH